jgi:hypothetical protein
MTKVFLLILLFATTALGEIDKTRLDLFKKESASLRGAVDDIMNTSVPGRGVLESAKATYLEGYGAVLTLEASLEPTRSPFTSPKTPAEVRNLVSERRKSIENKLQNLLKQRVQDLQSIDASESVTIVLYLINSNPADIPDLPGQIVLTIKKQDPTQVLVQAY